MLLVCLLLFASAGRARAWDEPRGQWIGGGGEGLNEFAASFNVSLAAHEDAILLASGIGFSEYLVDGRPAASESRLVDPVQTNYNLRVPYVRLNITALVASGGVHCLGVRLGAGWFSQNAYVPPAVPQPSYGPPRMLVTIVAVPRHSSRRLRAQRVLLESSPNSFKGRVGEYVTDGVYEGCTIDARRRLKTNWCSSFTTPAVPMTPPAGKLFLQASPPALLQQPCLAPVSAQRIFLNTHIYDFGVNQAAVLRIRTQGPRGVMVTARHGEFLRLDSPGDGMLVAYQNLRAAAATDNFILSGETDEFLPRFTYHGFRYAELMNLPANSTVEMCPLSSLPWFPTSQIFNSSNPWLQQIADNMMRAFRSNAVGIIADCPQRDERKGWLGDAALTVMPIMMSFPSEFTVPFYANFLDEILAQQMFNGNGIVSDTAPHSFGFKISDPCWGAAYPLILRAMVLTASSDAASVVAKHFPHALAWLDYLGSQVASSGIGKLYSHYGDWTTPPPAEPAPGSMTSGFCYMMQLEAMSDVATFVQNTTVFSQLQTTLNQTRLDYHKAWYNGTCGCYGDGTQQAASVFALASQSVPKNLIAKTLDDLTKLVARDGNHFSTGIVSVNHLFLTLSDYGFDTLAAQVLLEPTYPSYYWSVNNEFDNATNLHEIWNFWKATGEMNSYAHHMWGSVFEWFLTRLVGFRPQIGGHLVVSVPNLRGYSAIRDASGVFRGNRVAWRTMNDQLLVDLDLREEVDLVLPGHFTERLAAGTHHRSLFLPEPLSLEYAADPKNQFAHFFEQEFE